ncbi:MAG: PTS sugar transporter subunit IIA [Candidatus Schekmanbacteria bacterium]|nr:PTS sugar transporter subunit IIA [Candidatus Schekmanbacteria bacterium]
MQITECVSANSVVTELQGKDRHDVLRELVELLAANGHVPDYETALEHVLERESLESTCIGQGLAIPHARVAGLSNMAVAFGRSRPGIDFNALDGFPAHLVFLLLYPPKDAAKHLSFLSELSTLAVRHNLVARLMEAPDAGTILRVLADADAEHEASIARGAQQSVAGASEQRADEGGLVNPVIALLARLQRFEQHKAAIAGEPIPDALDEKILNIKSLVPKRHLDHFYKLMDRRGLAVVPVERGACQGCHMQFSSAFNQEISNPRRIFNCPSCRRFLFIV